MLTVEILIDKSEFYYPLEPGSSVFTKHPFKRNNAVVDKRILDLETTNATGFFGHKLTGNLSPHYLVRR